MLSFRYPLSSLVDVYTMIIFVYVLMSWIPTKRGILADIDNVLAKICDPYLNLFREIYTSPWRNGGR